MTKRNYYFFLFLAAILLFLSSCATILTTRATQVRLISVEELRECRSRCKFLGNVTSVSSYWCFTNWADYNNTLNGLLDNAAEIGATHLYVNPGDGPHLRGETFNCAYCQDANGNQESAVCLDESGNVIESYCQNSQGLEDYSYCKDMEDNEIDGYCHDEEGTPYGSAHCEGADYKNPSDCRFNGGKWIPAIDKMTCGSTSSEEKPLIWETHLSDPKTCQTIGGTWILKAETPDDCKTRNGRWIPGPSRYQECISRKGTWIPPAEDQLTCEEKGGKWVSDDDVLIKREDVY